MIETAPDLNVILSDRGRGAETSRGGGDAGAESEGSPQKRLAGFEPKKESVSAEETASPREFSPLITVASRRGASFQQEEKNMSSSSSSQQC